MADKLTLVSHHLCPYVQRAAITLAEKGVAFDRVYIDLDDRPAWFKEMSPLGKVPLLRVGEDVLFESAVIVEYLEETQPNPLHPQDALERAKHRAWMEFGSSLLGDLWVYETTGDRTAFDAKAKAMRGKFERLESTLGEGPYFAGRDFSVVDAVFAPMFRYFETFETITGAETFKGLHKVEAWRKALAARRSVIAAAGGDYADRLRAFLRKHNGVLAQMMPDRA
jgi:glutathione S-transferase